MHQNHWFVATLVVGFFAGWVSQNPGTSTVLMAAATFPVLLFFGLIASIDSVPLGVRTTAGILAEFVGDICLAVVGVVVYSWVRRIIRGRRAWSAATELSGVRQEGR
ncbi:hypothetical protein KO481_38720 [Nocardia sp. NEAU-G5]|uniref:Uncharacterized protein n=1 Tax=Nocardia albiluteola TaxID=2842303 RepID=A0ABS6BAX3_9NOCA|nr:hypothetical protein [Nocardia albiluteola]MBU3067444.1 hypothetical protein [Nocardia albiluteola]